MKDRERKLMIRLDFLPLLRSLEVQLGPMEKGGSLAPP